MAAGKPRLKLSETLQKTTLPGIKQVLRVFDENNRLYGADIVVLADEGDTSEMMFHVSEPEKSLPVKNLRQEPLLEQVMFAGKVISKPRSLTTMAKYTAERLAQLPAEYKRFENPHLYKVGISEKLLTLRDKLRHKYKKS
jgi:nicotinate phosphoribosyltransferase